MSINANAVLLSEDRIAKWLLEDSPFIMQIARVWPFLGVDGGSLSYASTGELLPFARTLDYCATLDDPGINPISPRKTFNFGELAASYEICTAAPDRFDTPNNVDSVQYALAVRRLLYQAVEKLANSRDEDSCSSY